MIKQANAHPREQLNEAMRQGRLHHGWVFAGPTGSGKKALAQEMAATLLSGRKFISLEAALNPTTAETLLAAGTHPDVLILQRQTDEKTGRLPQSHAVEDVRAVARFLSLTPSMGEYRIVLLQEAECLNRAGQNALLKILEEPPPRAVLLLLTPQPALLLPTIRSRCRILRFQDCAIEDVVLQLQTEHPEISEDTLHRIASFANGAPVLASQLIEAGGIGFIIEILRLFHKPAPSIAEWLSMAERVSRKDSEAPFLAFRTLVPQLLSDWLRARIHGQRPPQRLAEEGPAALSILQAKSLQQILNLIENITGLFQEAERGNLDRKLLCCRIMALLAGEDGLSSQSISG